jgi:ferredoxin
MTFVINDKCIGTVDKSCYEVCPVSCIYAIGQDPADPDEPLMLVIDPVECIDCAACVADCPVEAITADTDVPERFMEFIEINAMQTGRGDQDGPDFDAAEDKQDIAAAAWAAHTKIRAA